MLKILGVLAVIVGGILVVAALKPADFRISRSLSVAASPAVLFGQVNDLHKMNAWSPWLKMDPAAKGTYSGPAAGVGAQYAWAGNREVGEGRMTLIESQPNALIRYKLEFLKPFPGTSTAEFTFKPEGKQTVVTWSMFGKSAFPARVMCVFMNMDKMVGGTFEKGLADLKTRAEAKKA